MNAKKQKMATHSNVRTHMKCSIDGCSNPTAGRGLCRKHYQDARIKVGFGGKTCNECDRPFFAKGLCRYHYVKSKRKPRREPLRAAEAAEARQLLDQGKTYAEIAARFGVTRQAVQLWVRNRKRGEACSMCSASGVKLHNHHIDYVNDIVMTLCVGCHRTVEAYEKRRRLLLTQFATAGNR